MQQVIIKDEEVNTVTCPLRSVEVLQSILIGPDTERRGMAALLILRGSSAIDHELPL